MRASYPMIAVLLLASACATSEPPAPNKNTNWLTECASDEQCGDELACLCGICTVECNTAEACGEGGDATSCARADSVALQGQCRSAESSLAVCVAACEDDGDCTASGAGAHCEAGVCLSSSNAYEDGDSPCIVIGETCADIVAQGDGRITSIAVHGDRVYWLDDAEPESGVTAENGTLESALITGGGHVTLATGLQAPEQLRLDATHAYALLSTDIAASPYFRIVRVPLAGGDIEMLVSGAQQINTIALDDTHLYWLGNHDVGFETAQNGEYDLTSRIYRLPKTGAPGPSFETLSEHVILEDHIGGDSALAVTSDAVYWREGAMIRAMDLTSFEARDVIDAQSDYASSSQGIAVAGNELTWLWTQDSSTGLSRLDLSRAGASAIKSMPIEGVHHVSLVVDERSIYWTRENALNVVSVHRTDRATGETVVIAESDKLKNVQVAVSDEHLFLSVMHLSASGMPIGVATGYVVRLPKD